MTIVVTGLVLIVIVLALLVAGLLRSHAVILRRLHEAGVPELDGGGALLPLASDDDEPATPRPNDAPTGRAAPDLTGTSADGDPMVVAVAGRRHDTSLLFLSADCATCEPFWEAVGDGRAHRISTPEHRLVVVARGGESDLVATIAQRPADVPVLLSSEAWQDYQVPGSPYIVHVDGPSGRIRGEGTSASWDQLVDLASRGRSETTERFESGRARRRNRHSGRDDRPPRDSDGELEAVGILPGDPSLYSDGAEPVPDPDPHRPA